MVAQAGVQYKIKVERTLLREKDGQQVKWLWIMRKISGIREKLRLEVMEVS